MRARDAGDASPCPLIGRRAGDPHQRTSEDRGPNLNRPNDAKMRSLPGEMRGVQEDMRAMNEP